MLEVTHLPEPKMGHSTKPKYPWDALQVGQSFLIPYAEDMPKLISMRQYCHQRGKEIGAKFRAARLDDGSIQVYRYQ